MKRKFRLLHTISLSLAVLIVFLFGIAVYLVNQSPSNNETNTDQNGKAEYAIKIEKEKSFGAILKSDPVAYFTKLLFVATTFLAAFTIFLAIVTAAIWRDGKQIANRQHIAARRTLIHAVRSAKAAENAVEVANSSSERQLRAYILIAT